ncbi:MAG: putative colanic acid biosynthesis acetyltransferase, partial [Burkholderiaceae bacterium]
HVIISQDAYLCGATHDYNDAQFTYLAKPIAIEPYAWICARAVVMPGVTVHEGAVLGLGSVATRNLEAWSVYAGMPAKFINNRAKDIAS